jgi:hypothetical protein
MKKASISGAGVFLWVLLAALRNFAAQDLGTTTITEYQRRYSLNESSSKLVDNRGEGFEDLYGVSNFRAVLNGVLYRGGANNKYNKHGVRDNRNPLPLIGLNNLCEEGFGQVFYMYSTNYDKHSALTHCQRRFPLNQEATTHQMSYRQIGPWERQTQYTLLKAVYNAVQQPELGPVYLHCWNGWHASGLISAFALRQFCDFTGDQAVRYWDQNTDGNNRDKAYENYRQQIRKFVAFEDLKLSPEQQRLVCYDPR